MFQDLIKKFLPGDSVARTGILWNIASFAVIGGGGIVLNILIGYFYDSSVLGVFNQVMSFYVIIGQMGVWGLQSAAVYFVPRQNDEVSGLQSLLASFLAAAGVIAATASLLLFLIARPLGVYVFRSPDLYAGLLAASPALLFFSMNKLMLGFINGLRYMRSFAVLQGARYILIIIFILGCLIFRLPGSFAVYSLLFAEILLFIMSCAVLLRRIHPGNPSLAIIRDGLRFGSKSVVGGVVGEFNTKADILMLGMYCSDAIVGIYSFASILAEGFFTLIVVFRTNMNPLFSRYSHEKNYAALHSLRKQIYRKTLPLCALGAVAIGVLYVAMCVFVIPQHYAEAIVPLAVILLCMTVASPFIVSGNLLTQSGRPELDTIITAGALTISLIGNYVAIPIWGMLGAAMSTGFSYICYSIGIKYFTNKYIKTVD